MDKIFFPLVLTHLMGIGFLFSHVAGAAEVHQEAPVLLSEESSEETSPCWIEIPLPAPSSATPTATPAAPPPSSPRYSPSPSPLAEGDRDKTRESGVSAPPSQKEEKAVDATWECIYLEPSFPSLSRTIDLASLTYLPQLFVPSPSYQIEPKVEIDGSSYIFTLSTPHGLYRVRSIPALIQDLS